ncbi:MAG TPA: hypothetical protein VGY54_22910 [Polyangiaceae bacterium]|nr:hypothetical protein [Polyangiaceae bacterium]
MALRNGHGTGSGVPRVEVLPADELPRPLAAPLAAPGGPGERRKDGTADKEFARLLGRLGGLAKAASFAPYHQLADDFIAQHMPALTACAGGEVGAGPSSMVASAALQLGASRWAFDRGASKKDPALLKLGSSLANDSRQNLLAAFEMAVREAEALRKPGQSGLRPGWRYVDEPTTEVT